MSKLNKTLSLNLLGWGFLVSLNGCSRVIDVAGIYKVVGDEATSSDSISDEEIAKVIREDNGGEFSRLLSKDQNFLIRNFKPVSNSSQNMRVVSAICYDTKSNCIKASVDSGAMQRLVNGEFGEDWIENYSGMKIENPMILLTRASNQKPRQQYANAERAALAEILKVDGMRQFPGWDLTGASTRTTINDCRINLSDSDTKQSMARNLGVAGTPTRGNMLRTVDKEVSDMAVSVVIDAIKAEQEKVVTKQDKYWLCTRRSLLLALDPHGAIRDDLGESTIIDNIDGPEVLVKQVIDRMEQHITASETGAQDQIARSQKWLLTSATIVDEIDFNQIEQKKLGKVEFIANIISNKGQPLKKEDSGCVIS